MADPVCVQKEPYAVDVEAGRTYLWCACGLSKRQPFCDASHAGTGIVPVRYKAEQSETVYFCGCKATGTKPLCDDTHLSL